MTHLLRDCHTREKNFMPSHEILVVFLLGQIMDVTSFQYP